MDEAIRDGSTEYLKQHSIVASAVLGARGDRRLLPQWRRAAARGVCVSGAPVIDTH